MILQISNGHDGDKPTTAKGKTFEVGKMYRRQSITRVYDGHVWDVLENRFQKVWDMEGGPTKFEIVAPLPGKAEYLRLKERHYTYTVKELIEDAYAILEDLEQEMEMAFENTPENLQCSGVSQARRCAARELQSICAEQPEPPLCLSSECVVHYPLLEQSSRRARAAGRRKCSGRCQGCRRLPRQRSDINER